MLLMRLPAHAAGQRAVADHDDHVPTRAGELERLGQAVGVGQAGGGVAVLDEVVLALGPARVAGQAAALAQVVETGLAPGQDLVHVRLVTDVPQDRVVRRVEHPVQRHRQLDDPQVRPEMPAGPGNLRHQERTDLIAKSGQFLVIQPLEVVGSMHGVQQRHVSPR